ncbi:metallophosphoesterase [Arthrobacter oryzae]|uniref:3',5'-cyclic AMP phosphodiesterase CpdA n=1 Tax=Arthrobacter oryzae TaxID=409290 RepID=A0A495EFT2_9MICC|nr:metallophosphoesterase [Arthrobacter oryzae]RKR15566.1 3',5'-cyclic AMP phosphodiesterase CpdA [Arthrobacter oryzae]
MARSLGKRGKAATGAWVLSIALLLAACQPGPPEPSPVPGTPSSSSPAPPSSGGRPSPSAAPLPAGSVHFTAQGDIGVSTGAKKVLDVVAGLEPQLNLALGDFAYKAGIEQQFCDMVTARLGRDFPYQLVTGNHESDGHDGDIAKFVQCLPNKLPGIQGEYGTQWRVDVPAQKPVVRFILVSPGIDFRDGQPLDYSRDSERWRWTADAIDEAKSQNIPWTVVGMHTPCLSIGNYGCLAGQDFTNMLIEKKVDLVLSGHDHVYQRTHQLATGGACAELVPASFTSGCLADTDGSMVKGSGTVFATVGVGGVGLYDVHADDPEMRYFASTSGRNRDPALGTLDVTATADELAARFVPADGYTFSDSFTVRRR